MISCISAEVAITWEPGYCIPLKMQTTGSAADATIAVAIPTPPMPHTPYTVSVSSLEANTTGVVPVDRGIHARTSGT